MTQSNEDSGLRQIVDLLAINVGDIMLPQLARIEQTLGCHGERLGAVEQRLGAVEQRLEVHGLRLAHLTNVADQILVLAELMSTEIVALRRDVNKVESLAGRS